MIKTKYDRFEIEPPFLYGKKWTTQGGMYNVLEYGMIIARCPNVELAIRVMKSLESTTKKVD